jgi:2-C-methyl-D-erythritol 4-phosphate cytidylyltransferase
MDERHSNHEPRESMPRAQAIVVAAGRGERFGAKQPKQFLSLLGQPLFLHSMQTLARSPHVASLVLVVTPGWEDRARRFLKAAGLERRLAALVPGGATRQESVRHGLEALSTVGPVLIHDAVRPCLGLELVARTVVAARALGAAVAALPVSDTLMRQRDDETRGVQAEVLVDRRGIWAVQTPQVFELALLRRAHEAARLDGIEASDDGSLVLRLHHDVELVPGERDNIKVTTSADLEIAAEILRQRHHPGEDGPR